MTKEKILIVEDEAPLRESLSYTLRQEGYDVSAAKNGEEGLSLARATRPDLILLDLMLPGFSGLEVCRILRKESTVPVIMLTAKDSETDKIVGLELGADDYITKPFSIPEVLARMRAVLRRSAQLRENAGDASDVFETPGFKVNLASYELFSEDKTYKLSKKECGLLKLFIHHHGKVLKREFLIDRVWGDAFTGDEKTLDVHIRRLRKKIEKDPDKPRFLVTVRGVGYRFSAPPAE